MAGASFDIIRPDRSAQPDPTSERVEASRGAAAGNVLSWRHGDAAMTVDLLIRPAIAADDYLDKDEGKIGAEVCLFRLMKISQLLEAIRNNHE
jgi:hypothetical protein